MRWGIGGIVVLWFAAIAAAQPVPSRSCVDSVPQQANAQDAATKAFDKALAAKKLKRFSGKVSNIRAGNGTKPNQLTFSQRSDGSGLGIVEPPMELAVDAKKRVYEIVREPQGKKTVTLCGCGPVGSGVAVRFEQYVADLPAGYTYAGQVNIKYRDRSFDFRYEGRQADGRECPMPP